MIEDRDRIIIRKVVKSLERCDSQYAKDLFVRLIETDGPVFISVLDEKEYYRRVSSLTHDIPMSPISYDELMLTYHIKTYLIGYLFSKHKLEILKAVIDKAIRFSADAKSQDLRNYLNAIERVSDDAQRQWHEEDLV